ncbi:unnamed protein product, partial [marine sediment metagenome]
YISYDGMTEPLGQSQVIPYLIHLSEKGHNFVLLSAEKRASYYKYKNKIAGILKNNNINWVPVFYTKNPPVLSTIWDIIKLYHQTKKLHKKHKFNIIHCRSYISALIGLNLKKKYGVKFIFDMRGFFPDERVEANIWELNNFIFRRVYRYFKKKEKQFFKKSDFIISLTNAGKKAIQDEIMINEYDFNTQIEIIPCCTDMKHFSKDNISDKLVKKFKKELNIKENDFILCYLGSIGTWYLLEEMLQFFVCLLAKKENARSGGQAKFLFITKNSKAQILQKAEKYEIPKNK